MSDSRVLYTHHSNKLAWLTRQALFGDAQLLDADMTIDYARETQPDDVVTLIATQPLTSNEQWHPMNRGQFTVFQRGLKSYETEPT